MPLQAEPVVTPAVPATICTVALLADPRLMVYRCTLAVAVVQERIGAAEASDRGPDLEEQHLEDHLGCAADRARQSPVQETLRGMLQSVSSP